MADVKRLAYVLNDINSISESELQAYELLLDYDKNDLIFIKGDKTKFSLKSFIKESTKNFLSTNHTKTSNQHSIATEESSGFMSAEDKTNLDLALEKLERIYGSVENGSDPYIIESNEYIIQDDKLMLPNTKINFNEIIYMPGACVIGIGERPEYDFVNAYDKMSYRDDFIYFNPRTNNIDIMFNIAYYDDHIEHEGVTYYINKRQAYQYNNDELVPLYKIRRRNKEYISETNILGKLSYENLSNSELTDIGRYKVPYSESMDHLLEKTLNNNGVNLSNKTHSKILISNIKREITDDMLHYFPLNNDSIDRITNQDLGKNIIYKKSPFGNMMRTSSNIGNYITMDDITNFTIDFLIDTTILDDDEVLSLLTDTMNKKFVVYIKDRALSVNYNGSTIDVQFDKVRKYQTVKLIKTNSMLRVYINETYINYISIDNNVTFKFFHLSAINTAIGELVISNNEVYINPYINSNVYLCDSFVTTKDNPILINRKEQFYLDDTKKEGFVAKFANENVINKGDIIKLYFNKETIDLPIRHTTITSIAGNKIALSDTGITFQIGDLVKIYNDEYDLLNETFKIVNKSFGDNGVVYFYLDKCLSSKNVGYKITNANLCAPNGLSYQGEAIENIIKNGYTLNFIAKEAYDKPIDVNYIEKIESDNSLFNINKVNSVKFDNNYITNESNNILELANTDITYTYKDTLISNTQKRKPIVIINDDITLNLTFNLKDFITCANDISSILKTLNLDTTLSISGGSNDVFINDKKINTKGKVIDIILSKDDLIIDDDYNVNIVIKTASDAKKGKLILTDARVKFSFECDYQFSIKNGIGQVTDYAVISDNMLFLNTMAETKIFIEERQDNYFIVDNYTPLTKNYNGYVLGLVNGNIFIVHTSDNKAYYLDKYYVEVK